MTIKLAFEFGVDKRDGCGAACCSGREAKHGTARPAQVFVRSIHHQVGVRRVVNSGDLAMANAQVLVNHLHNGC